MKRFLSAMAMAMAMAILTAGLCGCDEEDDPIDSSGSTIPGTWNGTLVATRLMGQPVEESDVVPFTMTISDDGSHPEHGLSILFNANGYPGVFSGTWFDNSNEITFSTTADYHYAFVGNLGSGGTSMSGTWTVDIPGGMSGTWQASR